MADVAMLQKAKEELEQHIEQLIEQQHQLKEKLEQEGGLKSVHYKVCGKFQYLVPFG